MSDHSNEEPTADELRSSAGFVSNRDKIAAICTVAVSAFYFFQRGFAARLVSKTSAAVSNPDLMLQLRSTVAQMPVWLACSRTVCHRPNH